MKPSMKSKLFWNIIISWGLISLLQAQTLEQTVSIADKMMENGQYASALKYYQRAQFFGTRDTYHLINGKLGDAYFFNSQFDKAYQMYTTAYGLETDDSLKTEWFLKKVSSLLMQKKFKLALLELYNFNGKTFGQQQRNLFLLKATAYYGMHDFQHAEKNFLALLPASDSLKREQIHQWLTSPKLNRPHPETAFWLSIFIPGAGQIYAGDWKNGINSFVLNATLAYFFLKVSFEYTLVDAMASILPWFQRYYMGGYQRAKQTAERKRQQNRSEIYRKVFQTLQAP